MNDLTAVARAIPISAAIECKRRARFLALGLSLVLAIPSWHAMAETYYVNASAIDDSGDGTQHAPKKHLSSGMMLLSPSGGDTLLVESGIYSHDADAITRRTKIGYGRAGAYNTIKAVTDGGPIVTRALDLPLDAAFLQFEGIKWDHQERKSIVGHHLKFLRCAFRGGPPSGNAASLGVGTNDQTPGAQYILIEDSWIYGPGGRYKLVVYNAEFVVLRRVVARHDGGWEYDGRNPQGGITIYNSKDVHLQNGIVIDSDLGYKGWGAAIYHPKNKDPKTLPAHSGTRVKGSIVLNVAGMAVGYDGNGRIEDARIEDSVIWRASGGVSVNNGSHSILASNLTVGEISTTAFGMWGGRESELEVRNSVLHNVGIAFKRTLGTLTHNFNVCGNVGRGLCNSTGEATRNALDSGLRHLPRIEPRSWLKTAGANGGQAGAEIVQRIGKSGTLFGEPSFDAITAESLWPWPHEARLKRDFCQDATRGLCSTPLSLSEYVWGQLATR